MLLLIGSAYDNKEKVVINMTKLYSDLMEFIPVNGFNLYGNATLHTYELTRHIPLFDFYPLYGKIRSLIRNRADTDSKFKKLLKSFPYDFSYHYDYNKKRSFTRSRRSKRYRSKDNIRRIYFPAVPIDYGIKLKLSVIGDIGVIKSIIDPTILVASHKDNFNPMTYDYMSLAKRDDEYWKEVCHHMYDIFKSWHITGNMLDPLNKWRLTRVDLTCNIIVDRNYSIKNLLYYYRRTLKRCGYSVRSFSHPGQDAQTAECWNKSQRFVAYNKSYEQQSKYGRNYPYRVMRFEVQILARKMPYIRKLLWKEFGIRSSAPLNFVLSSISKLSPFIIYKSIDTIFVDGDYYTEKAMKKRIKKLHCQRDTKDEIMSIAREISKYRSYSAIRDFISLYKEAHGANIFNYRLNLLREIKVSPIILEENHSYTFRKLPCIKTVFLSAIINSSLNNLSNELEYIKAFNIQQD